MVETHNLSNSAAPEYRAWTNMKARCFNPNDPHFPTYGGRGITVCPEWQRSFEAFLADIDSRPSPEHTLDRIDNDGDYRPGNVRWTTWDEQSRNRNGSVLLSQPQVAERLGIDVRTVRRMIGLDQLPWRWVGSRKKVPADAVELYVAVRDGTEVGSMTAFALLEVLTQTGSSS
jgi:hypothetical protein